MSKAAGPRKAEAASDTAPTPAELLRARAAAAGEEVAELMRRAASGEKLPAIVDYKADNAALRAENAALRDDATVLAGRNEVLERQLAALTREAQDSDDSGLKRRADELAKHLDAADRHVTS